MSSIIPKTVLVVGNFNVLHAGHLRLFKFARSCGDLFMVGVNSDRVAGHGAYVSEELRLECVQHTNWIDDAFLVDEPVQSLILRLRPHILIKGKEYESRFNPELDSLNSYGGRLLFNSGESIFSSVDLIRKSFYEKTANYIKLPEDFLSRHNINHDRLVNILNAFTRLRVGVIGDLIIDEYITCEPLGMSQEDPTIVVTPIDSTYFLGGAAIVAAHAAGLGAAVQFMSVAGNDAMRDYAIKQLSVASVETHLLQDDERPTTLKQRFRSRGKTLLRVSHLHQRAISVELQGRLLQRIENALSALDILVFSDFNYGCLPQSLVEKICTLARAHGVMLVADSQSSSQTGDINRFQGMDLICPTEREARIATRNQDDGLVVLAEQLRVQSNARHVLLKLGEEGLLLQTEGQFPDRWITDRIGAFNRSPRDVAGAGDSLLIAAALALGSGSTIWEAGIIGSIAASVQVGRVGNTPLNSAEILEQLHGPKG